MKLSEMLMLYRGNANPHMQAIMAEFADLKRSDQIELLLWMTVDNATNPTTVRTQNAPAKQ